MKRIIKKVIARNLFIIHFYQERKASMRKNIISWMRLYQKEKKD